MAYTNAWDETVPADTQLASLIGQDIRNLELNIRERIVSFAAGPIASRLNPESVWGTATTGVMFFATDTGKLYRWNNAAWVEITANFMPVNFTDVTAVAVQTGNMNTVTIPAATAIVGSVIDITAYAISSGAAGLGNFILTFGGATLVSATPSGAVNDPIILRARVLVTGAATQTAIGSFDNIAAWPTGSVFSRSAPNKIIANNIIVNLDATGGWTGGTTQSGGFLVVTVGK